MKSKSRSLLLFPAAACLLVLSFTHSLGQSTWTGATGAEWGTADNWTGGVPNSAGAVANINSALTVNVSDTGTGGAYPYTFGTLATSLTSGSAVVGTTSTTTDVLIAATLSGAPVVSVASGGSIFFYSNLEGTQGFEKTGGGKLTFRFNGADQNYSGDIVISGGILGINQNGSLGNDNNDIFIANGARLFAEPGSNSGTITLPSTRTITLTGSQSQIGSNNAAVNLVINGTVTEDAAGKGLVKTDAGKVTLAGSIGYTGETRIAGGTLALSGSAALPTAQNLRFTGTTGSLDLGGTSQTVRTIVMDNTAGNKTITGGGALTINGDANQQLSAANGVTYDFSGIDSFTFDRANRNFNVQAANVASVTTLMDLNLAKAGTNGGVNTITAAQILVGGGNSDGNNGNTSRLHLGTTNTLNANSIQIGGFNAGGVVDFQSGLTSPSLKVRGTDGNSAVTTWKIGETSSGTRRGEGVINLTGGTLYAATITTGGGAFAANSERNLNLAGGTLRNISGNDLGVNGLDTTAAGRINVNVSAASAIHANVGSTIILGGNTRLDGSGALSKSGDGTLLINGASSTYTGTLGVNAGTLAGQTTLGGAITLGSGGTIAPGNSVGTIGANSLTWEGDGLMSFDLSNVDDSSDLIVLAATWSKGAAGIWSFNFNDTGLLGETYTLVTFGSTDFGVADFSFSNLGGGYTGNFALSGSDLTFTVIPEPAVSLLGGLGTLMLLRRRRGARRNFRVTGFSPQSPR